MVKSTDELAEYVGVGTQRKRMVCLGCGNRFVARTVSKAYDIPCPNCDSINTEVDSGRRSQAKFGFGGPWNMHGGYTE